MSEVTYKILIEHKNVDNVLITEWVNVNITLDQKSKSKTKNRSRAAKAVKELYPNCTINQIIYN